MHVYVWAGIVFFLLLVFVMKYNALVKFKNVRKQAYADIDVQLKQRFDLVPNLISTIKWYMQHEKTVLQDLTNARTNFLNAGNENDKIHADNMLSWTLKSIFAIAENYPDLKASTNFMQLQNELTDLENKIAAARRFFNSSTQEYNTFLEKFPNNIIANMLDFKKGDMYEVEGESGRKAVKVEF